MAFININSLRQTAWEWKIFFSGTETYTDIQDAIKTVTDIHQARGSEDGIKADVDRLCGYDSTTVESVNLDEKTYGKVIYGKDKYGAGGVPVGVKITTQNNSLYLSDAEVEDIIRKEFVPAYFDVEIVFA